MARGPVVSVGVPRIRALPTALRITARAARLRPRQCVGVRQAARVGVSGGVRLPVSPVAHATIALVARARDARLDGPGGRQCSQANLIYLYS